MRALTPLIFQVVIFMRCRLSSIREREEWQKLVPQPQDAVAFGFWILNEAPMRSSTKSISEPDRYSSETGIDQDLGSLALDHDIVLRRFADEVEAVLKAGAAAAFDRNAEHGRGRLAGYDLGDALGCAFGKGHGMGRHEVILCAWADRLRPDANTARKHRYSRVAVK